MRDRVSQFLRERRCASRVCLPILCALVLTVQSPAQSSPGGQPSVSPSISAAAAQADFDLLRHAIEEAHGGLDRFSSKAELSRRFDAHRARLAQPLTTIGFAGILSETIAELRDGHARLEYDSLTNAMLAAAPVLPLRVMFEGEKLVVLYNDSPADSAIRPGMELVSINGRQVSDVIPTLLKKISGDGFIETGKRYRLARQFAQQYWLFIEPASSFAIAARGADGRTIRVTLPGVLERNRRVNVNPVNAVISANTAQLDTPSGNIGLEFLANSAIAHIRVRAFDGETFPAELDNVFRTVREKGTQSLILDLRGNGGGVDEYGALLVSYFTNRPFRYFDHIHLTTIAPSFATWKPSTFENTRAGTEPLASGGYRVTGALHKGVTEHQPAAQPFPGKLVVLIDGGSFSTTADVAAQLRSQKRATFVGEETGGGYDGNTSGLNASIVLPNSKLSLRIMMYGYWNAVVPDMPGRGTRPDITVTRTVADIIRGNDAALNRAMTMAMTK